VDLTTSAGIVRYYYVYNGHGDVVALVDTNGTSEKQACAYRGGWRVSAPVDGA
jgi:hypothetical protein